MQKRHNTVLMMIDDPRPPLCSLRSLRPDGRPLVASSIPSHLKLYVGGLSPTTDDEAFRRFFETFGSVKESQVVQDHNTGQSRGFGFITFDSESAVDSVLSGAVRAASIAHPEPKRSS